MVYAFPMTKGGQQVPQAKSKAKARARSRAMTNGAEQTPDVSLPRPPHERPPIVFVRDETLEPSNARPKVRISRGGGGGVCVRCMVLCVQGVRLW